MMNRNEPHRKRKNIWMKRRTIANVTASKAGKAPLAITGRQGTAAS
jgi:hypothetical protein